MRFRSALVSVLAVALLSVFAPVPAGAIDIWSPVCKPRSTPPKVGLTLVGTEKVDARTRLYTFRSAAVGPDATPGGVVHARVIVPVGYDQGRKRYPVLYDLHGTGGNATSMPPAIRQEIIGDRGVILVSPDGGVNGFYSDWFGTNLTGMDVGGTVADPPPAWETFHIKELLPWIDSHYRTNKVRGVFGQSMGGFGAMSYAARHPDLFVTAGSFSGAVDTDLLYPVGPVVLSLAYDPCVWGDPVTQYDNWQAHNPTALAENLRGLSLFVASGNGLPGRYDPFPPDMDPATLAEASALEGTVHSMSQNLVAALQHDGVPVTTWFYGNGTHPWGAGHQNQNYEYDDLKRFLPQAMDAFRAARVSTSDDRWFALRN